MYLKTVFNQTILNRKYKLIPIHTIQHKDRRDDGSFNSKLMNGFRKF